MVTHIARVSINRVSTRALVWMNTNVYMVIYDSHNNKSKDQPCKVFNPARGQLNRENDFFPVPVRA